MDVGDWQKLIGHRVVVRHRLTGGGVTDAVGRLAAVDGALHLDTRHGPVRVELGQVVAGKEVPPRPTRPGPPHRVVSITDLQAVMAMHWQPPDAERLGGWLLRAAGGFTNRANSALPLADPPPAPDAPVLREALREALAGCRGWYAARGLPAQLSVAGPVPDGAPDDDGPASRAGAAATSAGWSVVPDGSALVLTAPIAALTAGGPVPDGLTAGGSLPGGLTVRSADRPDDGWLDTNRYRGRPLPAHALDLLVSAPEQVFVSVLDGARTVAVARGSLGGGWAGLTGVEVRPDARRRGLGTALLGLVAQWARRGGAASMWLQVAESNTVARQLYASNGFAPHHRYEYLRDPGGAGQASLR